MTPPRTVARLAPPCEGMSTREASPRLGRAEAAASGRRRRSDQPPQATAHCEASSVRARFHGRLHHRTNRASRENSIHEADFGAMAVTRYARVVEVALLAAETTEAFCDGHNAAFAFFGGVPRSILYDNTKLAVRSWAMGSGSERASSRSESHYLFEAGSAGRARATTRARSRDWSASSGGPWSPRVESFAALNDALAEQCRRRQAARLPTETIGEAAGSSSSLAIAACSL